MNEVRNPKNKCNYNAKSSKKQSKVSNGVNLTELTIFQAHQGLVKKEFSAVELCKAYLKRIKEKDKDIFAFLTKSEDSALSQAKRVDDLISKGEEVPVLAGIPTAIKDNILVEGIKCTAGSKILENYIAPYDATVVKKLKEKGAVILGKTNLDEFAMGSSTENSAFFPTRNPHDLTRVPGGTSGGSAAAVVADMCVYSLGSDMGGSIRQPASFCGAVGLKPTYGRVSRYGLITVFPSVDQIGPLTKTVEDARIVFNVISGKDPLDSNSTECSYVGRLTDLQGLKIGVPKEYFIEGIEQEVEGAVKEAIKKFDDLGAIITEISLPHTKYALPCYYIIMFAEGSSNLARYDGMKYGFSKEEEDLMGVYLESRKKGLGVEVKRRIMLGTYVLSAGYYEAYYIRAQRVRTKIKEDFEEAFKKVDVILTPVSPTPAFKLGEKISDPLLMYLCDVFTAPVNLAGLPAISIPCGKVAPHHFCPKSGGGLPVGLQIIGPAFSEEKIFKIGEIFEKVK